MKTKITIFAFVLLLCAANVVAQGGKAEPKRIKFATGKSSITLSGTLSNDQQMEYVFGAKKGQKISLKVISQPKGKFFDFELAGADFEIETVDDYYTDFSFKAPETGDYFVFVRKRPTESTKKAKFSLTLSIK